jgi:hypothetical protein
MHLRDRYPSAVQQILEPHLMAQRERQLGVDPIPPDQQPPGGPADGRIDEPVRTPARLRRDRVHRAPQLGLDPPGDDSLVLTLRDTHDRPPGSIAPSGMTARDGVARSPVDQLTE